MIFFLLFYFFSSIRADCLEFVNVSSINQCLIVVSQPPDNFTRDYYPHCLQCTIETSIEPENIQLEEENQCLILEIQCIQLKFPTKEIFEDFFQIHQELLYDVFYKENSTEQNTLHIIITKNTLKEIDADYIEEIFQFKYRAYRALFIELHLQNEILQINRNLIDLNPLSIKLILICGDTHQRQATIYIFHEGNITLESKYDPCAPVFIPSIEIITSTSIITTTTLPIESIPVSQEQSRNIILIIILLTAFLLCTCITSLFYCLKRFRHRYRRLSKEFDAVSELSVSQDETPLTPTVQPKLSLKLKRPLRGMHALQLLEDDV